MKAYLLFLLVCANSSGIIQMLLARFTSEFLKQKRFFVHLQTDNKPLAGTTLTKFSLTGIIFLNTMRQLARWGLICKWFIWYLNIYITINHTFFSNVPSFTKFHIITVYWEHKPQKVAVLESSCTGWIKIFHLLNDMWIFCIFQRKIKSCCLEKLSMQVQIRKNLL